MQSENEGQSLSRRDFVAVATGVAVGCLALPVLEHGAFAAEASASTIDVGPVSDYSHDMVVDKFAKKEDKAHAVLVVRKGDKLYVTSGICTHKGCVVQGQADNIVCNCHHSTFNSAGVPQKGPAKLPLVRYAVSLNGDKHVVVDMSKQFMQSNWDAEGASLKV